MLASWHFQASAIHRSSSIFPGSKSIGVIDPSNACLFIPAHLKAFKLNLFERIGATISKAGGTVLRGDFASLDKQDKIPIIGCTPELKPFIDKWRTTGRIWIYWDRGYNRRVFATDLPVGRDGGMYRWHVGTFQMQELRDVPSDRWKATATDLWPWQKNGRHVLVAEPSPTYQRFHGIEGWLPRTIAALKAVTDRPIVTRDKEMQRFSTKLHQHLKGAHCLVTHGSNAAVEAAIMGCPVFVHPDSAAALVGKTDIVEIESPTYPDRSPWVHSLAYSQFSERELVDGTLWRLMT